MFKKLLSKSVSAVVALAICCVAVLGCLVSVSALSYDGTYTVSVGDSDHHIAYLSNSVTARVTLNLDAGFAGGEFGVAKSNGKGGDYGAVTKVTPVSAVATDGSSVAASDIEASIGTAADADNNVNDVTFVIGNGETFCKSVTLDVTVTAGDGWYFDRNIGAGQINNFYSISFNIGTMGTKYDTDETTFTLSGDNTFHVCMIGYENVPETLSADGVGVVEGTCHGCGSKGKHVQMFADPYNDGTAMSAGGPFGWTLANGVTVDYGNGDGSLSLNVHGRFVYGSNFRAIVCDANGNYIKDSNGNVKYCSTSDITLTQSPLAGTSLHADSDDRIKTFRIDGLSAKDIDKELYITLICKQGDKIQFSNTVKFSLKDYAMGIISGENVVYPDDTSEEIKTADKNVAAALINYGVTAYNIDLHKNDDSSEDTENDGIGTVDYIEKKTVKWTVDFPITTDAAFVESITEGDGTSDNPYIITTPEQLAYLSASAGDNSIGKYYKVADDIAAFDMTQYSIDATAQGVLAGVNESWNKWYQNANTSPFQGNFDGNGVVIYGIQGTSWQTGLFPHVKNATIKNLGVQASYFKSSGNNGSAAIVGRTSGTLTVENCSVKNCYITSAGSGPLGTILGGTGNNNHIIIKNCFVSGNIVTESTNYVYGGITSGGYTQPSDYEFSNIVAVGNNVVATIPDGVSGGLVNVTDTSCYTDSYTDQATDSTYTGITVLTTEQMTGANAITNMSALDFDNTWFANSSVPVLRAMHDIVLVSTSKTTHNYVCRVKDCGLTGIEESHNFVESADGATKDCACGYSEKGSGIAYVNPTLLTWDGTQATGFAGGSGTESDPYIIETPEQLAYLALSTTLDSADKYYKVADNRIFNMDGMQGVDRTSDAATVKNAAKTTHNWAGDSAKFSGNFDGNGLVVYNLYSNGGYNGLFPNMTTNNTSKSSTIKNVTVLSSYISGYHYSGGIVGFANGSPGNTLNIENCAVENCFISDNGTTNTACNRTSGTFVGSVVHNGGTISNCLAKNNDTLATDITGGFIGTSSDYGSSVLIKNSVSIGTLPYSVQSEGSTRAIGKKCNQPADYTNIYTDQTVDSSFTGITTLTAEQMTGENAKTNMSALDFDSTWFAVNGNTPVLRALHNITCVSDGASGHHEICCVKGCDIVGVTTAHTFSANTCTVCGYEKSGDASLEAAVKEILNSNSVYSSKFATDDLFKAAYAADVNPTNVDDDCFLYATSLNLKANPYIAFTFGFKNAYIENKADITATFTVDGTVLATVTGDKMVNNTGAGKYHLYRFTSIPAIKLCKTISVSVTYNGTTTDMGTYSVAGFAINAINAGSNYRYHAEAAKSIVYYSEMLAARYGA